MKPDNFMIDIKDAFTFKEEHLDDKEFIEKILWEVYNFDMVLIDFGHSASFHLKGLLWTV